MTANVMSSKCLSNFNFQDVTLLSEKLIRFPILLLKLCGIKLNPYKGFVFLNVFQNVNNLVLKKDKSTEILTFMI